MTKKFLSTFTFVLFFSLLSAACQQDEFQYKTGDIIFQSSKSGQSLAVQLATKSKYSHVAMIIMIEGKPMVFEAVQPVKLTPLKEFIKHGDNKHYVVKRLKKGIKWNESEIQSFMTNTLNKNYDIYFNWGDNEWYCSELVWKFYKRLANIELSTLRYLESFDLTHPEVKRILRQRYGKKIPLKEQVVAPSDIFDSSLLVTVKIEGRI